jgi:Cu-Zn family superoxide dismutase
MTNRILWLLAMVALVATVACGPAEEDKTEKVTAADGETEVETGGNYAEAMIDPLGDHQATGMAIFSEKAGEITLQLDISKATPGVHAAHIHENGDCSAPDGSSAGGHWNPTEMDHGKWGEAPFHLGDLGNIEVGADGNGSLSLTTDRWTMGTSEPNDIVGHAIIIHVKEDDFTTQPTGAAGGRIACGVIVKK